MNVKKFVVNTKSVFRHSLVVLAVLIPVVCAVVYLTVAVVNSRRTTQVATYWLPDNHLVVTNCPEADKVYINMMEEFRKTLVTDNPVIVYVGMPEVQYFSKIGTNLLASPRVRCEGYSNTGMGFDYDHRPLEDGKIEITFQRSYLVIAWGIILSLIGGVILDVALLMVWAGVWYLVPDRIKDFMCAQSTLCTQIKKEWQNTPAVF